MTSAEHDRLVVLGALWFKRNGFPLVATELISAGSREQPDVYACRQTCSAIIEVKVSRSDFLADAKKMGRQAGLLGTYRFYLCPEGLIQVEDLPAGWGLLYAKGKRGIDPVLAPHGNLWPSHHNAMGHWANFSHETDYWTERSAIFSMARRLAEGSTLC